jgi:hypothetical protein
LGHINTSNSSLNWSVNNGSASFPSLSSDSSSLSSLAVNSSSVRGSGDLITVSVSPTGNYIYLNNGGVLGGYNVSGIPANFIYYLLNRANYLLHRAKYYILAYL